MFSFAARRRTRVWPFGEELCCSSPLSSSSRPSPACIASVLGRALLRRLESRETAQGGYIFSLCRCIPLLLGAIILSPIAAPSTAIPSQFSKTKCHYFQFLLNYGIWHHTLCTMYISLGGPCPCVRDRRVVDSPSQVYRAPVLFKQVCTRVVHIRLKCGGVLWTGGSASQF